MAFEISVNFKVHFFIIGMFELEELLVVSIGIFLGGHLVKKLTVMWNHTHTKECGLGSLVICVWYYTHIACCTLMGIVGN